jgi:DNA-3-methyladenine glycosylase
VGGGLTGSDQMLGGQDQGPAAGALLPREFFARPALEVASRLLGEAYEGSADPASHAYRGRTARNAVMFGPPGHAYVYFTYGMHFCVNLVCMKEGTASAVLLRAGRVVEGVPLATARRAAGRNGAGRDLARGPARLCQALGIGRALDGADVCDPASPLRIRPGGPGPAVDVSRGPRVGISAASERPWRFWLTGDPTVSPYRPHVPRARPKPVWAPDRSGGTIQQ